MPAAGIVDFGMGFSWQSVTMCNTSHTLGMVSTDVLYKRMANETRTANVMVRITPSMKAMAERAAKNDTRSLSSLIEKLLTEHLKAEGYLPVEQPHARRIAQGAADAKGMAHSAIDEALQHSTEPAKVHRERRRALTEMPARIVAKDRRRK